MSYVLYGLDLAAHIVLIGLLVFLCFRTKSKGLILITVPVLMSQVLGWIFKQVIESDWWADKTTGALPLNMGPAELLWTVTLGQSLLYKSLFFLGLFLIYREWRQGKFAIRSDLVA